MCVYQSLTLISLGCVYGIFMTAIGNRQDASHREGFKPLSLASPRPWAAKYMRVGNPQSPTRRLHLYNSHREE